jgi:hypothetical protein
MHASFISIPLSISILFLTLSCFDFFQRGRMNGGELPKVVKMKRSFSIGISSFDLF